MYTDENEVSLENAIDLSPNGLGQYQGQAFAEKFSHVIKGQHKFETLMSGPDNEEYNEAWEAVLNETILHINYVDHWLYQDENGNLWAVPSK